MKLNLQRSHNCQPERSESPLPFMTIPCFAAQVPVRGTVRVHSLRAVRLPRKSPQFVRRRTRSVGLSLNAPPERQKRAKEPAADGKIDVVRVTESPGGFLIDLDIFHRSNDTKHTIIIAKGLISDLCAGLPSELPPEKVAELAFRFLMSKGQSLANTEGLQDSSVFPVNYFSMRTIFHFYPDGYEKIASACKSYVEA